APVAQRPLTCDRCGQAFLARAVRCPNCGLDRTSAEARELRELAAAARRIQTFRELDLLDAPTCERVYRCIEERQRVLLRGPAPPLAPETPPAQPEAPVVAPDPVIEAIPVAEPAPETSPPEPVLVAPPAPLASPPEEPPRAPPRRSLAELLAGFMEQRNI